jgi:hypothetical protein
MSISVQELDNTVRALFEGKGEIVSDITTDARIESQFLLQPKLISGNHADTNHCI